MVAALRGAAVVAGLSQSNNLPVDEDGPSVDDAASYDGTVVVVVVVAGAAALHEEEAAVDLS